MKRLLWVFAVLAITLVVLDRHAAAQVPFGTDAAGATAQVAVHPSQVGPPVTTALFGVDSNIQRDVTSPSQVAGFQGVPITAIRFPSDRTDYWHCYDNSTKTGACIGGGSTSPNAPCNLPVNANSTFPNFMTMAVAAGLDVNLGVNYGSNYNCTHGGDPTEAAGWLNYCQTTWAGQCTWVTVGSEQYRAVPLSTCGGAGQPMCPNAIDLRNNPGSGKQYGRVFNDYYADIHAAAVATVKVGVNAFSQSKDPTWDSQAKQAITSGPDFAEMEYYAENPGSESDPFLLQQAPAVFTAQVNTTKVRWPGIPIYVDQVGSVPNNPGKQTQSITNALFAAEIIGEAAADGISRMTWHTGFGASPSTPPPSGNVPNFSSTLYGFQTCGDSSIFSLNDTAVCSTETAPYGTLLATANAFIVASNFIHNGEHMVGSTVSGNQLVRSYAATYNGGYAVMLFNLGFNTSVNTTVSIDGVTAGTGGNVIQYTKGLYDNSASNTWSPPSTTTFGSWSTSLVESLPPWSVTVLQFTSPTPTPTPSPTPPAVLGSYIFGGGNFYGCCPDVDPGATPDQHLMAGVIDAAANTASNLATNCPGPGAGNVTGCTPGKYINSLWLICDTPLTTTIFGAISDEAAFGHVYPGAISSGNRDSNGNYGDCGGGTPGTKPVYFMNPGDATYQSLLYTDAWSSNTAAGFPAPYAVSEDNFGIVGFPCNQLTEYGQNQPCNLVGNGAHNAGVSWEAALASFSNNTCQAKCVEFIGNGLTPGGGSQTGACSSIFKGHCYVPGFNGVIDDQDALDSFCAAATSGNVIGLEAEEIVFLKGSAPNPTYANSQTMVYMLNTMADLYTHTSDGCAQANVIDIESSSGSFYPLSGYNQGSVAKGIPIRMEDLAFEWLVPNPVTLMPDRIRPLYFTTGGTSDSSEVPYFFEQTMVPQGAERSSNKFAWNGFTQSVGDGCRNGGSDGSGDMGGAVSLVATCVSDPDSGAAVFLQQYKHLWVNGTDYGPAAVLLNTSSATSVPISAAWFNCTGCDPLSSYAYSLKLVGGELASVPYPGIGPIAMPCSNVMFCTGSSSLSAQTTSIPSSIGPRSGLILLGSQ